MSKLEQLNLDKHILCWICSYLTNRYQRVVLAGETSTWTGITSGVPQGSVLGPLLFIIYINNVSNINLGPNTSINIFADDMLLYSVIENAESFKHVQAGVNAVNDWVSANHLSLNYLKCKFMIISHKRSPILPVNISLGNSKLQSVIQTTNI